MVKKTRQNQTNLVNDDKYDLNYLMVVTKKISCLADDKKYDRNYKVMLTIMNTAKNCQDDQQVTKPTHWPPTEVLRVMTLSPDTMVSKL
jgi:hypothetical protein